MKRVFYLKIFLIGFYSVLLSSTNTIPLKVRIVKKETSFELIVNEQPYFIKGAAGITHLSAVKKYGGNSIRTWSSTGVQQLMDSAYQLGLTVTLGLEMALERQGFHYADKKLVNSQFERLKSEIIKYKNHPALLMWGIGNELELLHDGFEIWDAVEQLAGYIHSVDPDHPVTTMIAGVPKIHLAEIKKRCPSLDLLAVNAFKDLPYVADKLKTV